MKLELQSFLTTDKLQLPALLYSPDKPTKKVAIWLHGNGDNGVFYNPMRMNAVGDALAAKDIAFFSFNNRGAHNSKSLKLVDESLAEEDQVYQGGTFYEKLSDCVQDIDGALVHLRSLGYSEFYLIGLSTGANKICVYDSRRPQNDFSKYILAAHGDDTGLYCEMLGEHTFQVALDYARGCTAAGKPLTLMPSNTGMAPYSAAAAYDVLNPDGDYNTAPFYEIVSSRLGSKPFFKEYRNITKPMLILYGQDDEYATTAGGVANAIKITKSYTNSAAQAAFVSLAKAGHSFSGSELIFASTVADWLAS